MATCSQAFARITLSPWRAFTLRTTEPRNVPVAGYWPVSTPSRRPGPASLPVACRSILDRNPAGRDRENTVPRWPQEQIPGRRVSHPERRRLVNRTRRHVGHQRFFRFPRWPWDWHPPLSRQLCVARPPGLGRGSKIIKSGFRPVVEAVAFVEDRWWIGGAEGDRTPDLIIANDTLSQLSYCPAATVFSSQIRGRVKSGPQRFSGRAGGRRPRCRQPGGHLQGGRSRGRCDRG